MHNTIILQKGEAQLTRREFLEFQKCDTIYGNNSEPVELRRWNIEEEEDAKAELACYCCEYCRANDDCYTITEYALEYCETDEDGEFLSGSDYDFAIERMNFALFQEAALEGNGVQNDSSNVWVEVDGEQYTIALSDVLEDGESEPFEASDSLESDLYAPGWDLLYEEYCKAHSPVSRIYYLRKKTGLTQKEFADKYHFSVRSVSNWETNSRQCPEYVEYLLGRIIELESK